MTAERLPIPMRDGKIDRAAWLELRRPHFNASDSGALYGVDPYKTAADVAVTKITGDTFDGNEATRRGNVLEPALLNWLSDELSVDITPPTHVYLCDSVMMTPDGEITGSNTDLPEAKTAARWTAGDEFPLHWRLQAIAQCVARPSLERVHFVVLDGFLRITHHVVEPAEWEKDDLRKRAQDFLAWVSMGLVPDDLALSYENVRTLWPEPKVDVLEADDAAVDMATQWADYRKQRLEVEKYEASMRDALADLMREHEVLARDGEPLVTFRANGRGRTMAAAKALR